MDPLQLLRLQLVAPANCRVLIPPQSCDDFCWRSSSGWAVRGSQCQQPQHPDAAGKVWARQQRTHRSLTGRRAHTLAVRGVLANVLRDSRSRRLAASEVDHPSGDVNADERAVEQRSAKSTPRSTRLCGWPASPCPARVRMSDFSNVLYCTLSTGPACTSHWMSMMVEDSIKKSPRAAFGPEENEPGAVLSRTRRKMTRVYMYRSGQPVYSAP